VLARCSQILLLASVAILAITFSFVFQELRPEYLQPVLGEGFGKVWQVIFPVTVTFPYGETIVFGMVWYAVGKGRARSALWAVAVSGLILAALAALETGTLGDHLVRTSFFPLLEMTREVDVSYLFNRMDPMAALLLNLGGFIKVSVCAYAATQGLAHWLGLREYRPLVPPMGVLLASLCLAIGRSHQEHIFIGLKIVPYYMHVPLQIIVPSALLILAETKRWMGRRNPPAQASQRDRTW